MRYCLAALMFMLAGSLSALRIGDEVHFISEGNNYNGKVKYFERNGQVLVCYREISHAWVYAKDLSLAVETIEGLSEGDCISFDNGRRIGTVHKIFANGMLKIEYFDRFFRSKTWRDVNAVTRLASCSG